MKLQQDVHIDKLSIACFCEQSARFGIPDEIVCKKSLRQAPLHNVALPSAECVVTLVFSHDVSDSGGHKTIWKQQSWKVESKRRAPRKFKTRVKKPARLPGR